MACDPKDEQIERLTAELAAERARVKVLEETIERLLKRIEDLERAGKRQAGPFSKGDPKPNPKRPGRKPGKDYGNRAFRERPTNVDETFEVPLPANCPGCGGVVEEVRVADQFQIDLPPVRPITRQFRVHVGQCCGCGRRVQPRHALQTSDALGAAGVQIGPSALATGIALNKVYGPSWSKVSSFLHKAFGLKVSASALCRAALRVGDRLGPTQVSLEQAVAASPIVYPDETGWRCGGHRRWLWAFVAAQVTVYKIAASRGGEVAEAVLGEFFAGILGRDGWAAYLRFKAARHQSCLGHHMRRAHEILLVAKQGAAKFAHGVLRVLKGALALRDRRDTLTQHGFVSLRGKLEAKLDWYLSWRPTYDPNRRFRNHLFREREHLFTFLEVPGLEATNWPAEQAIRPAVIARKLSGCNRTDRGAQAQERIMSLARTAWQQDRDVFDLLVRALRARGPIDLGLVPEPAG